MNSASPSGLLLKGIEEEVYTGTREGEVIGMSHEIAADLQGFVSEPDCRNAEFASPPIRDYRDLGNALLGSRRLLRNYLACRGGLTLLPGASLSLGDSSVFIRSNPNNPYHSYIEKTYGTNVVTTSAHLNIGIEDPEQLIRAYRLIRAEASLFLALSAASPFLDRKVTGYHSVRWKIFPHTPSHVPFFEDHAHYVDWVGRQLDAGTMQNIRHLWASTRPNGVGAPQKIQRLELRICDRIDDLATELAFTALMETRIHQALQDPGLDPLSIRDGDELVAWSVANEQACADRSLAARVKRWDTGHEVDAGQWVRDLLDQVGDTAGSLGISSYLEPIERVLEEDTAQRWLRAHAGGASIDTIIRDAAVEMEEKEAQLTF